MRNPLDAIARRWRDRRVGPGAGELSRDEILDAAAHERLIEAERGEGLEWTGRGTNRAQRRAAVRRLKLATRPPVALVSLRHPLLGTVTPHGAAVLRRRRARARAAAQTRRQQRRRAR